MLPTMEDYRAFGVSEGQKIGPVDWYGFSQMKRWDHGILPNLRAIAGFDDRSGMGTYTACPDYSNQEALDHIVEGFREGATEA